MAFQRAEHLTEAHVQGLRFGPDGWGLASTINCCTHSLALVFLKVLMQVTEVSSFGLYECVTTCNSFTLH